MVDLEKYHKFQQVDDHTCGPTVVSIIYDALGIQRSIDDICSDMVFMEEGTYASDIADELLQHDIDVSMIFANAYLFDESFNQKTNKEKIAHLEQWLDYNKTMFTTVLQSIYCFF